MRVLVTGGAGFLGSKLVLASVQAGHEVRVIDDFSTGRRGNLSGAREVPEIVEGSIVDLDAVRAATRECEVVFHLAALPSVPLSLEDPVRTHAVNATGTLNVLQASREEGVRRVVYASSCAVYGSPARLPVSEGDPAAPASPYALQKYMGELYATRFTEIYGLDCVGLRYFNVYGPGQDPASPYAAVIPRFLTAVAKGERPRIFGDGRQSRDFVYVADVVRATLAAARAPSEVSGRLFNVGSGIEVTLLGLLETMSTVLDREALRPEHISARPGDVRRSVACVREAESRLGWRAETSLEEGLAATALAGGAVP